MGLRAAQWIPYDNESEMAEKLTEDQRDEIEALHCVYGDEQLRVRFGHEAGVVQLQLQDVVLEKHRCNVTVTLSLTHGYPLEAPTLTVHSAHIQSRLLRKVEEQVMEHFVEGEPAGHLLLTEAEDALTRLEAGVVASQFVYCFACSAKDVNEGKPKQPQPGSPDFKECLVCSSRVVVPLKSAHPNHEGKICDFCLCEDSMLVKLKCKEVVCVDCFQRWAEIDIGAKKLVKELTTGQYTITCPTHANSALQDTTLLKLTAPRSYNLYTRFAFDMAVEAAGGVTCPLPGCTNYPFLPGSRHNFMHCPYCSRWFCDVCHNSVTGCVCVNLKVHSETHHPWPFLKHHAANKYVSEAGYAAALERTGEELVPIRVKYHDGAHDCAVVRSGKVMDLMEMLSIVLHHDFYYRQRLADPWGHTPTYGIPDFVPVNMMLLLFNGRTLEPGATFDFVETGIQIHAILQYPSTREFTAEIEGEVSLHHFRRGMHAPGAAHQTDKEKRQRGDFMGKACPHCDKPVLHYYKHGCHHIGFAGEGCCDKHWCYVCKGPHPCLNPKCTPFCDNQRTCKCPLCPDCKPGEPCPSCTGCPKCQTFGTSDNFDLFD